MSVVPRELQKCATCAFYAEPGECHRLSPKLARNVEGTTMDAGWWPDVGKDRWCGEYEFGQWEDGSEPAQNEREDKE